MLYATSYKFIMTTVIYIDINKYCIKRFGIKMFYTIFYSIVSVSILIHFLE